MCRTQTVSTDPETLRPAAVRRIASLGIIPGLPDFPNNTLSTTSRVVWLVVPQAHPSVARSKRRPSHQLG